MKKCLLILLIMSLCTGIVIPRKATAHPHVFIDTDVTIHSTADGVSSLDVVWTFDTMSSDMFLVDLDTNADGTLSPEEWAAQRADIEGYLAEQSFYVHVIVGGERVFLQNVSEFVAKYENGVLTYSMKLPLSVKASGNTKVQVAIFDPTYYTDFYTPLDAVRVEGASNMELTIDDAPELAFYQGQIIPAAITFEV